MELRATAPPAQRLARLATAHFRPEQGTTAAEKREQFVPLIAKAAAERADLLVLPETLTYYQATTFEDAAEPIPGPSTEFFGALARQHDMYIVITNAHFRPSNIVWKRPDAGPRWPDS